MQSLLETGLNYYSLVRMHRTTNFHAMDIHSKIVQNLRRQNNDSYECNFCHMVLSVERSLWSHITTNHQEKCPQDGDELLRFRTHMKEICQRKGYVKSNHSFRGPRRESFRIKEQIWLIRSFGILSHLHTRFFCYSPLVYLRGSLI